MKRKQKYNYTPIKIIFWLTLFACLALSFQALALDMAYDFPVYGHTRKSVPLATKQIKTDRLDALSRVIAKKEGYYRKGTLAERNNNPGNLVFAHQHHAVKSGRWAKFTTPEQGFEALKAQIKLDAKRGHTLERFIHKYAPPKENNTVGYIAYVSNELHILPTDKLSTIVGE